MVKRVLISLFIILVAGLAACQPAPTMSPAPVPSATQILPSDTPPPAATATAAITEQPSATATTTIETIRFAVIGDYGSGDINEASVAKMVRGWNPDIILTVGDNNYPLGEAASIDDNIGQFYHSYISPYTGKYGAGADVNRFFPTLGNHDWYTKDASPYFKYFQLPGSERYYDFVWGPVHFFALDSDGNEPDGNTSDSVQAKWLQSGLAASTSIWNIVYFHYPPYSSALHGSIAFMRWPFAQWGASAVISGHDHTYERLLVDDIPYFVNGLGGGTIYDFNDPLPESIVRYNASFGAMLVTASPTRILFEFYNRYGVLVD